MANWKKIILKDDNAELAQVTASVGLNITTVPLGSAGSSGDNVVVVDDSGNLKSILQSNVAGTDTTYTADGSTISISNNTFSVMPGGIQHDSLDGWFANQHIAWDTASAFVIHDTNYTDTTYDNGTGILESNNTFSVNPLQPTITQVGALSAGSIAAGFGVIYTTGNISSSGGITGSTVNAYNLNTTNATVTGILTANEINATTVDITGSLTVTGSLIYNSNTFEDAVADQSTGSTIWGSAETDTHYFSGSVTASGDVNAATFTGNGANITNISNANVNTQTLAAANGLSMASPTSYDGTGNTTLTLHTNGPTLDLSASGLKIADGQVNTTQLANSAVTSVKLGAASVTAGKLHSTVISTAGDAGALADTHQILISTGSGQNELAKTTLLDLAAYVDTTLDYTNNAGTVTTVTGASTVLDLSITPSTTDGAVTLSLAGTIYVDNANWTDAGADLSLVNGGTGQSTAAAAADALLNINHGGGLTIGTAGDTITIPGNLDINGTLTSIDTVNLEIKDRFILIGSGSTGDSGIQFGEQASAGNMLFWDSQYNQTSSGGANVGRFGVGYSENATAGDSDIDVGEAAYHLAAVISGSAGNNYQEQIGNIKLEAGGAWIYA